MVTYRGRLIVAITFATNRLLIRRFNTEDWKALYEYLSDPLVVKYENYSIKSEEECQTISNSFSKSKDYWAICLVDTNMLIGHIFLGEAGPFFLSIGCVINRSFHRQGYAAEAVQSILEYAFIVEKAHRVDAISDSRNIPSWRYLEYLGFKREGCLREHVTRECNQFGKPIWIDSYIYSMLEYEWKEKYNGALR